MGLVGYGEKENLNSTNEELFNDVKRVEYMKSYLQALAETMRYTFHSHYAQQTMLMKK